MMTQTSVKQNCDPKAVAVAEAVYDAARPVAVILFGSRARGDHREESDIDLLVITEDADEEVDWRPGYVDLCQAAHQSVEEVYGFFLNVDVVTFPKTQFQYYRRARNHVTGQAMRDGVIVTGNPQDFPGELSGEPSNWPDIRVRFIAATRNIRSMSDLVISQQPAGRHRLSRPAGHRERPQSLDFRAGRRIPEHPRHRVAGRHCPPSPCGS